MFATERRQRILDHLRENGAATVRDLARIVIASEGTVRRDLRELEDQGLLERRRGGAAPAGSRLDGQARAAKNPVASLEKLAIAELAATLVQDGDAVVLGAGTTTQQLADRLVGVRDLTVVTNSLLVGEALARSPQAVVVMTGGSLRGSTYGLVGSAAEQSFVGLRVRRAFLSGDGLTATHGLSASDLSAAGVDRAIAQAAQEVLVLADHTKLGVDAMFQTVPPERVAHLVTDELADPEILARLRDLGVTVHVAPVAREADDED
ncbi:MAG: DeoR/GlpR family DNA-binding transcription regulator [Cellulomonas sp.]